MQVFMRSTNNNNVCLFFLDKIERQFRLEVGFLRAQCIQKTLLGLKEKRPFE